MKFLIFYLLMTSNSSWTQSSLDFFPFDINYFSEDTLKNAKEFDKIKGIQLQPKRNLINTQSFHSKYPNFLPSALEKYPTMTLVSKGSFSEIFPVSDENCSIPFNIRNTLVGEDFSSACRAHDYCFYDFEFEEETSLEQKFNKCNTVFRNSLHLFCNEKYKSYQEAAKCEYSESMIDFKPTHFLKSTLGVISSSGKMLAKTAINKSLLNACKSEAEIIYSSVHYGGYDSFLIDQEITANFLIDLLSFHKEKNGHEVLRDFSKEFSVRLNIENRIKNYQKYCNRVKTENERIKTIKDLPFFGRIKKESGEFFKMRTEVSAFNACSHKNQKLVSLFRGNCQNTDSCL